MTTPTARLRRQRRQRSLRIRQLPEPEAPTVPSPKMGRVMTGRPFRFGVVAAQARSGAEWAEKARRIESMGYAAMVAPDGLKYTLAPLPALTAAAMATRSLRVGTYVIAHDFRNTVLLAKEGGEGE